MALHDLTDVEEFATVQCITDGDELRNANLEPSPQKLANRTLYLRNRIYGTDSADSLILGAPSASNGWTLDVDVDPSLAFYQWTQSSVASAGYLTWQLDLPKKGRIYTVSATIAPASGHAGLPATMPKLYLLSASLSSGAAPTVLGSSTDSSASVSAYETEHPLAVTGLSNTWDFAAGIGADQIWFVQLCGEAGTNSVAGLYSRVAAVEIGPS